MRTLLFIALAASTAATPALAQDGDFSGPRAEAIFGWDHSDDPIGYEVNGLVYGGAIGYDWQRGNKVFGVEGEITGSTLKDERTFAPDSSVEGAVGRDIYVGGRVGISVGGRTLLYAKGGYSNVAGHYNVESPIEDYHWKGTNDGWRVGAGAEVKLTDKAYLKSEYRFSHYGADPRHQVVTGLGIRF